MAFDISQPIAWQTVEDALATWVITVLGIEVAWANQAEPQPPYPFAMLNIAGPGVIGVGDEMRTREKSAPDTWESEARGQREITVSVQIDVGPLEGNNPLAHARHLATQLVASLSLETFWRPLDAAGLSVIGPLPVTDLSLVVANRFTDRKLLEIRMGLASSVTEDIDVIEKTTIDGTVSKVDGNTLTVGPLDIDSTV